VRGEKTMPFGPNGEHVPVRLIDAATPANNRLTVCNQWTYQAGSVEKRFDVVFLVNGLPVVIGEAKTPTRSAVTWFDGAFQINENYEKQVPAMFVPNAFSFATEGRLYRYGSIRMPIDMWGPWRDEENQQEGQLHHVKATVASMLRPSAPPAFRLGLSTHFDAWPDWHEAITSVLRRPQVRRAEVVGVGAGRVEWTYFRWPGHEDAWSNHQRGEPEQDLLLEAARAFRAEGLSVAAFVDLYAPGWIRADSS
jgi:hypothetical protein